jgi:hypothetical protein
MAHPQVVKLKTRAVKPRKKLPLARIRQAHNAAALAAGILSTIILESDTAEQLAVAVKALRTIAALGDKTINKSQRAKGIANGALRRIGA